MYYNTRFDLGLVSTLLRYLPRMLQYPNVGLLLGPYSNVLNKLDVKEKFIRNWCKISKVSVV